MRARTKEQMMIAAMMIEMGEIETTKLIETNEDADECYVEAWEQWDILGGRVEEELRGCW